MMKEGLARAEICVDEACPCIEDMYLVDLLL